MSIEIIDDRSIWDSFVDNNPDKLLFFKWDFLKIIEKHSGHRLLSYGIFDERKKKILGLLPLFFYNKMGLRFLFSQPPCSGVPYIGLLMNPEYYLFRQRQKERYLNDVVDEITKKIEELSPNFINLSFGPHIRDIRPFQWNDFDIGVHYTYTIDLTLPLDTIWNSFDKNCRNKIRSGEKHNLFLKETRDTKTLCSKIEDRYRQQGLNFPFFGSDYLDDIVTSFPQNVKIVSVYNEDNIIDFAVNYAYNDRIVLWMGGVGLAKTIHSNEFAIGEFIKNAKSEGLKILEIQGADTERLCSFKSKFNPVTEASFSVMKKDVIGRISEFLYLNYIRRVWILFLVILQYFFMDASFLYSCSAC